MFSPFIQTVNGRVIAIIDGLKKSKEGRKMPAVKCLHQESANNGKAEYIMGQHFECISLLTGIKNQFFAVPLVAYIAEGVFFSPADQMKTILDRVIGMVSSSLANRRFYLVADAYYAAKKLMTACMEQGHHLISRMRTNAVAWEAAPKEDRTKKKNKRGKPKTYGVKVVLRKLFDDLPLFIPGQSPVYGEENVKIHYRMLDLLLRPFAIAVRIVLVIHPTRGRIILVTTDTLIEPLDLIRIYGCRFKIEVAFKQAIWTLGAYAYHFWMASMEKIKKPSGDQHVYKKPKSYQNQVKRKLNAYELYVQLGLIAHGLIIYLSLTAKSIVWRSFGTWFRTMKTDKCPSELIVTCALRKTFWVFLWNLPKNNIWKKFIKRKIDLSRSQDSKLVA